MEGAKEGGGASPGDYTKASTMPVLLAVHCHVPRRPGRTASTASKQLLVRQIGLCPAQVAGVAGVLVEDDHLDKADTEDGKAVRRGTTKTSHGQCVQPRPDTPEDGSDGASGISDDEADEDLEEDEEGREDGALLRSGAKRRQDSALLDAVQVPASASRQLHTWLSAVQLPLGSSSCLMTVLPELVRLILAFGLWRPCDPLPRKAEGAAGGHSHPSL